MQRIVAGGTGLIGKRLVEHWLQQKQTVTVVGRSLQHIKAIFGDRVQGLEWDRLTVETLKSAEVIVNLTGANIGEKRWTDARKQEILTSRLNPTHQIANLLAEIPHAPPLFNASAIGIYGLQKQLYDGLPPRLDEGTPIDWSNPSDFLSLIGRRWEKAAEPALASGKRVVFMRFGVVLAKEGGALPQLARPYYFFAGGPLGTGYQPFSWIAIDDLIRAIDFLLSKPELSGAFNLVAPECVTQRTLAEAIGQSLHRPAKIRMPEFFLKRILGKDMATELLLEGQNIYPRRLLKAGFEFEYPTLQAALNHLLH